MSEVVLGDTVREIRSAANVVRESSAKIATAVEKASSTAISAAYIIGVRDGCVMTSIALILLYLVANLIKR